MPEGEFFKGGMQHYRRAGAPQDKIELPRKGFEEKLHELRAGDAAEVARKYAFGKDVESLLSRHNQDPAELSEGVCAEFLQQNQRYQGYHPALVRAVAEEITAQKQAEETMRNAKH